MKNINTKLRFLTGLFATILLAISLSLTAQTPPPPNGSGGDPTQGGNTPVGGGAPIAGGIGILLVLGAAYGGKKVYDFNKRKLAE